MVCVDELGFKIVAVGSFFFSRLRFVVSCKYEVCQLFFAVHVLLYGKLV
jgi:hypothetical protein